MFLFRVDVALLRKIGILKSCSFGLKNLFEFLKIRLLKYSAKTSKRLKTEEKKGKKGDFSLNMQVIFLLSSHKNLVTI